MKRFCELCPALCAAFCAALLLTVPARADAIVPPLERASGSILPVVICVLLVVCVSVAVWQFVKKKKK